MSRFTTMELSGSGGEFQMMSTPLPTRGLSRRANKSPTELLVATSSWPATTELTLV
jgi:hypothetical protein